MDEQIKTVLSIIKGKTEDDPRNYGLFNDYLSVLREAVKSDPKESICFIRDIQRKSGLALRGSQTEFEAKQWHDLNKETYSIAAQFDFNSYLIFLEWERKPPERFYLPRISIMRKVVAAMQRLVDDELDELFLSMPPRVGKTTILMFFVTWLIGRDSEASNLYSAYSDIITSSFYSGVLEVLRDPVTYAWDKVFPDCKIVATNAKDETLNIDRNKRYPSLTCRSLYGTLNGACDCNGLLISDDLIGGIEEALNKDRLIAAWSKVDNNLIPRAKEQAKILWCGTRWSIADPAGLRMDLLRTDSRFANRRYEIINLPALDKDDHSNFNYQYGVGFSDEFYIQRRASFEHNNDMASWLAQYQGEPVERSGALFEPDDMRFYNGELPQDGLVRVFMAVDPAFGGGDFTAAPICYEYEDGTIYVVDVVYSDGDKTITQPLICEKIDKWGVQACQFEATRTTASYHERIDEMLRERGNRINIISRAAPNNVAKEVRIKDKAPQIREFFFLEPSKRTKEYEMFMQNVYSFKINGKNKHDDSVDSLAQAVDMITRTSVPTVVIGKRLW
jgi:predicted phage terminase large subunit-like protein